MRQKKNFFQKNVLPYFKIFYTSKYQKQNQQRRNKLFLKSSPKKIAPSRSKSFIITANTFRSYIPQHIEKKYLYSGSLAGACVLLLVVLFGPFFTIHNIQITKQDSVTNMELAYQSVDRFRGISLFQIDTTAIRKQLHTQQNNLENITIRILPPQTLKIQLTSFVPVFNTLLQEKNYLLLSDGSVVPAKINPDIPNITIISSRVPKKFLSYKQIFDPSYIKRIQNIINELQENLIQVQIESIIYYQRERELHIITQNNNRLMFDLETSGNNQIKKLAIFEVQQKIISKNDIIYTDLRVKNKIFFCSNETEYICKKNLNSLYPE